MGKESRFVLLATAAVLSLAGTTTRAADNKRIDDPITSINFDLIPEGTVFNSESIVLQGDTDVVGEVHATGLLATDSGVQFADGAIQTTAAPGPQQICDVVATVCPPPSQTLSLGIRDSSRDLVIRNNDAAPATVVDVTAAEVLLQDASGQAMRVAPVALSVDADASGANGVDTGVSEPGNWYHIWIIFDPVSGSAAGLLSLDPDEPALPPGYAYKARVGAIRTDSTTGELIRIYQVGHRVVRELKRAIVQPSQVFVEPVSIASIVPPTARQVSGIWDTSVYDTAGYGRVSATPQGLGPKAFGFAFAIDGREGNLNTFDSFEIPIAVPQTLYLTLYNGVVDLKVSGWEF